MPHLELHSRHLHLLLQVLNHFAPEAEVWAFGSRVTGTGHDRSDLDLVLRDPPQLQRPIPQLDRLREALRESNLPMMVDVLDWARLPENFRRQIDQTHVVVRLPLAASQTALPSKG